VRIGVLVDGKSREDRVISAREGPVPLRVTLNGARELTLVVEFGPGNDVWGHVDWADARLIK
jgi:hypothetical protein